MRIIIAAAKANLKAAFEYRGPILVWSLTSAIALLAISFFWLASDFNPEISYSRSELLTYYFLGILVGHAVRLYIYHPVQQEIQDGTINIILTKPVTYLSYWFGKEIGWKIIEIVPWFLLSIPFYLLFRQYLNLALAPQGNIVWFALALVFSVIITFLVSFSMGLASFWFTEVSAIYGFHWLLVYLFGGRIVPITFFPQHFQGMVNLLPFRYTFAFPIEIYLGKIGGQDLILGILTGAFWCLVLFVLANKLFARGTKVYGAFGG